MRPMATPPITTGRRRLFRRRRPSPLLRR
jgi:hypothetical protein